MGRQGGNLNITYYNTTQPAELRIVLCKGWTGWTRFLYNVHKNFSGI